MWSDQTDGVVRWTQHGSDSGLSVIVYKKVVPIWVTMVLAILDIRKSHLYVRTQTLFSLYTCTVHTATFSGDP